MASTSVSVLGYSCLVAIEALGVDQGVLRKYVDEDEGVEQTLEHHSKAE